MAGLRPHAIKLAVLTFGVVLLVSAPPSSAADWPTARGNSQRTGNLDDQPAPKAPKVFWVYRAREHFVSSPVPDVRGVYVAGLGPFNTGVFHCLAVEPAPADREAWSKSAPFLKRPVVCAPATAEGLVFFGDGMHQTDGAILYCLQANTGRSLWQFPVPGRLVHLESSPTVDQGRVYVGGGGAGVLCLDFRTVTLDGRELDLPTARGLLEKRWSELLAKYDEDKKVDPTFAVPPNEEALPKPAPRLLWQRGQGTWHVDAPLAVVGEKVLAASSYLDDEQVGKRSLLCLRAGDGGVAWETPLKINPWAGPTITPDTKIVLVGCSSIRFDRKRIKQAEGEIVAADLASGQVRWRKDVPGGVLSPVAVKAVPNPEQPGSGTSNDLAVFTATDGKVRAWDAATGEQKWIYEGANPFFAGPAVADGVVYAADLKGVLCALGLADGKPIWTLDVSADPAVRLPGMVFGSPLVHGGQLFLATCNLEGEPADQPCVVVCIADRSAVAQAKPAAAIAIDKERRTVAIPCKIAPRKLASLKEVYPIEVVATYPAPQGQKAHETVVTFEARPSEVHQALEELGLRPGRPARGQEGTPSGPQVGLFLELPGPGDRPRRIPMERTLIDRRTGKPVPPLKWFFTGSAMIQPDPEKEYRAYGADINGTLITAFPVTDETVFQSNLTMKDSQLLKLETNRSLLAEEGAPARLIIEARAASAEPSPPPAGGQADEHLFPPPPSPAPGPQVNPSSRLIPAVATAALPPADVSLKPRSLERGPAPLLRPQSVGDLPAVATESGPGPMEGRALPVGPPARAVAPDPDQLPSLRGEKRAAAARIDSAADPTADLLRRAVLAILPGFRQAAAPFLRLVLPDPFEALTTFQLRDPPPDEDPPAPSPALPGKIVLPTQ